MSPRWRNLALVGFLLALGGGVLIFGAAELLGALGAMRARADTVVAGGAPFYGLVSGAAMLLLGALILAVDVLGLKAGPKLVRAVGVGLAATIGALAVVPPVAGALMDQSLKRAGYEQCRTEGRGRWSSTLWTRADRACAPTLSDH